MKFARICKIAGGAAIAAAVACALVASPARADARNDPIALSNSYIGNDLVGDTVQVAERVVSLVLKHELKAAVTPTP